MSPEAVHRLRATAFLEARSALAGPLPWALLALAVMVALSLNVTTFTSATAAEAPYVSSVHAVSWTLGMAAFLIYAMGAVLLAGWARLRDDESGVADLLHATPLTACEYMVGKWAGTLAALAIPLVVHVAALAAYHRWGPLPAGTARGPLEISAYLLPILLFVLPQVALAAAAGLAVAEWSGRPLAVFSLPVAYLFAGFLLLSWGPPGLATGVEALLTALDPTGLRWLVRVDFGVDRGVAFYNHRGLPVDLPFLAGRLFTLALAGAAFAAALRHRRGDARGKTADPAGRAFSEPAAGPEAVTVEATPRPAMTQRPPGGLKGTWAVARAEMREVFGQPVLYALTPLLLLLLADTFTASGAAGLRPVPSAGHLAVGGLGVMTAFLALLLLFVTTEALHRERTTGAAPLVYATPIPTGALVVGKVLAAQLAAASAVVAATLLAMIFLVVHPQAQLQWAPFAVVWGGLLLPTLWLWSALVALVRSVVRSRMATYAIGLATLVLLAWHLRAAATWQTDPTLLAVGLRWSDLGAFQLDRAALVWNRVGTVALGLLCLVAATRLFRRVEPDRTSTGFRRRGFDGWRPALARWLAVAIPTAVLLSAVAVLGHLIADGSDGQAVRRADAEYHRRHLLTWADRPTADVVHLELSVDLDPEERRATVEGRYLLVNPHDTPLAALPFTLPRGVGALGWSLDGRPVEPRADHGLSVLRPAKPLAPGATAEVTFNYAARFPAGTSRRGRPPAQFVLPAGVHLHTLRDSFLPEVGFDPHRGADPELAPPRPEADWWRAELPPGVGARRPFTIRVTVSVPAGYTATSVGQRVRAATRDGREVTVWRSDVPVRAVNVTAGRWRVRSGAGAAVHFHPGHGANTDALLVTLAAAREAYSRWFGPYPWPELRLVEYPNLDANAMGFPSNMPMSEDLGFRATPRDGVDATFLVVAHEAAHQWWGNLLAPAAGPGTAYLAEGLPHWSALLLAEDVHGDEARRDLARSFEASYVASRRPGREVPLLEVTDDSGGAHRAVVYEKGAWVTWMMQEHLGREVFLAALSDFIAEYRDSRDHPTTQDLLVSLRRRAPDPAAFDRFVDRWFATVTLPEIRLREAQRRRVSGGWKVTATVENHGGGEVEVEVALETVGGTAARPQRVIVSSGRPAGVRWTVAEAPAGILVDPGVRLLQVGREAAGVRFGKPSPSAYPSTP